MSKPSTVRVGVGLGERDAGPPGPAADVGDHRARRRQRGVHLGHAGEGAGELLLVPGPVAVGLRLARLGAELVPADPAAGAVGLEQVGQLRADGGEHPGERREVAEAGLVGHHLGGGRRDRVDPGVGVVVGPVEGEQAGHRLLLQPLAGIARMGGRCGRRAGRGGRAVGRPGCGTSRGGRPGRPTGCRRCRAGPRRSARPARLVVGVVVAVMPVMVPPPRWARHRHLTYPAGEPDALRVFDGSDGSWSARIPQRLG